MATVSIGQPTVYMRERSLIERFDDLEWLRLQRSPEKEREYEQGFQGSSRTASAEFTGLVLKARIGEELAKEENPAQPLPQDDEPAPAEPASGSGTTPPAAGATPPSGDTEAAPDDSKKDDGADPGEALKKLDSTALGKAFEALNAEKPTVSPRDKLVNRLAFRDTVAEAIRERSLDDVHDLEGNALYEVQFDLSIVGGADPGQAYAVMLRIDDANEGGHNEQVALDAATKRGIVERLRAACLVEIVETTARYDDNWLTASDSPHIQEAELRGVVAARHSDLMALHRRMVEAEQAQLDLWHELGEQKHPMPPRWQERLESLGSRPENPEAIALGDEWTKWDNTPLSALEFQDRVVSGTIEQVKNANDMLPAFFTRCRDLLRRLAARQATLRTLTAELEQAQDEAARMAAQERIRAIARELKDRKRQGLRGKPELAASLDKLSTEGARPPEDQVLNKALMELRSVNEELATDPATEREAHDVLDAELQRLIYETSQRQADQAPYDEMELLGNYLDGIERTPALERLLGDLREGEGEGYAAFALPPTSISSGSASARSVADEEHFQELLKRLETAALDERRADEIVDLLWTPSDEAIHRFTRRALGFAIARYHAENSGDVFTYDDLVPARGLDARALLPLLLREEASLQLPEGGPPRVVSVTPSEVAEQITTSALSDIRRAFSLALDGLFRGTIAQASANLDRLSQEMRRYELIGRNPLLVGFVGGDVEPGKGSNSFGWIIGPRLETSTSGRATLRYRQVSGHYSVTATLVAPAKLRELRLCYKAFKIGDSGEWLECRTVPHPLEQVRTVGFPSSASPGIRDDNTITVQLPMNPDVLAQAVLRNRWSGSEPRILAARADRDAARSSTKTDGKAKDGPEEPRALWRLRAGEKGAITVLGRNLWRNPQVYVGGQRATRVQIMSDLGGLWAEFDPLRPPADQDGKPVLVDLLVSTSRGSDRILNGVAVLPAKADVKPPEPRFGPPVQAVAPVITPKNGEDLIARFGLRFELVPPLPKVWSELHLRARLKGAAAYFRETRISDAQVVLDPQKPGTFEIRDISLEKDPGQPWKPVEILEVMLQVRDTNLGDLRSVHATPVEVALVRQPVNCTPEPGAVVLAEKIGENWYVADETVMKLNANVPLKPVHAESLLPELKPGVWVAARLKPVGLPVFIAAKDGEIGRTWQLKLPKGTPIAAVPSQATFAVELGRVEWAVTLDVRPKP